MNKTFWKPKNEKINNKQIFYLTESKTKKLKKTKIWWKILELYKKIEKNENCIKIFWNPKNEKIKNKFFTWRKVKQKNWNEMKIWRKISKSDKKIEKEWKLKQKIGKIKKRENRKQTNLQENKNKNFVNKKNEGKNINFIEIAQKIKKKIEENRKWKNQKKKF